MGLKTRLLASGKTEDNEFNISLLGFKMAVNEGLTVFNLVDGVVDEFHDESGTDEGESSNDLYCASGDNYLNQTAAVAISAGFSTTAITEPQTSTAATNPTNGSGTLGAFTVPSGLTSVAIKVWGAGGSSSWDTPGYGDYNNTGGGGGFTSGTLAVTGSQVLRISAGEGGKGIMSPAAPCAERDAHPIMGGGERGGGGAAGVFTTNSITPGCHSAPGVYMVAGAGGASGGFASSSDGGVGGGLTGGAGDGDGTTAQTTNSGSAESSGGGGDQEQGGQGLAPGPQSPSPGTGAFLAGGERSSTGGGGGSGYYGGGAGGRPGSQSPGDRVGASGGGSSYYGHPQITSGATEAGEACASSGGETDPQWSPIPYNAGEGGNSGSPTGGSQAGFDGFVLITGCQSGTTTSTTIVSNAFSAGTVPTTSRIVVFEEDIDSLTLNTDIIASISRDGGTTFTTATLSDSGYVTGSSGQRILTGQAVISGQPSGQSMRWKLALANNSSKIHGVSLQWS